MQRRTIILPIATFVGGVLLGLWLSLYAMRDELRQVASDLVSERMDSFDESVDAGSRIIYRAQVLNEKIDILGKPTGSLECELWRRAKEEYVALLDANKYFQIKDPEVLDGAPGLMARGSLSGFESLGNDRDAVCGERES